MNSIAKITVLIMACCLLLAGCAGQQENIPDRAVYNGREYVLIEYPANIFYYSFSGRGSENFEEPDGIYPVESPRWDMIWNGGDLYCAEACAAEATAYYSDDENYDWYVTVDSPEDDSEEHHPVLLSADELKAVYSMDEKKRDTSAFWEEFEALGSLVKISKDGVVRAVISIVKYDGSWYWNTEVINESREADGAWAEYLQPLPETLDRKIKEAE